MRKQSKFVKRLLRNSESGQVIVILAIGFIILLGFVGIVTDVSLLFVRYNTLRRAVDAASVAAAGQVRKTVPTNAEYAQAGCAVGSDCPVAEGYAAARNYAGLNLAARQFIEFYGLSPTEVIIEMCASRPGDPELCTPEQRKLVRVTAQVESPTVFLRLLGWPTLTLEATALSETAALDVVIIMDVSESMGEETTYDDWYAVGRGYRYLPARVEDMYMNNVGGVQTAYPPNSAPFWDYVLSRTQTQLDTDNGGIFAPVQFMPAGLSTAGQSPTHQDCRVAMFPSSLSKSIPSWLLSEYRSGPGGPTYATMPVDGRWDGFMPQYNYFGCCNDPIDRNFVFDNLVCQPFLDARNATDEFLDRIDFIRGDRVAFVTYDREAFLIDPDGPNLPQTHMIDNAVNAHSTLEQMIGVRATDDFYADVNPVDGQWDSFVVNPPNAGGPRNEGAGYFRGVPVGELTDYPVKDSCTFQNAVLSDWYTIYTSNYPSNPPAPPNQGAGLLAGYHDDLPGWPAGQGVTRSYQRWAQCRGGNIGGALREANNALVHPDTTRSLGTIWIMVLLSDGAAGASDPVRRKGFGLRQAEVYPDGSPSFQPDGGEYGAYGVCPYGIGTELGDVAETPFVLPFCADESPESRHFCMDMDNPPRDPVTGSIYADIGQFNCQSNYDVDDYAREWADLVGLADDSQGGEAQLPTIFTIGFGLQFEGGTTICRVGSINSADILDCLGEEMLRYIADVGDNFRIDTNYQQDWTDNRFYDDSITDYGTRGPCEQPLAAADSNSIEPFDAGENCGNYYNAPTPAELELVFDDIASRMFTRLAR